MRYAIILSIIILLVCFVYSFYFQIKPLGDEKAHNRIALNLLEGRGFVERTDIPIENDRAICYFAHGYFWFLALLYKLFGHHYAVVWIVQSLFHAFTAFLIFLICLNVFKKDISQKIGLLAMGLYGFWPDLIESTAMLLTEPLFLFFVTLAVYIAVKFFKDPSLEKILLLSVVIGFGSSIRLTMILFALVFVILIFVKKLEKKYVYSLSLIIIPIIILLPFMFQNYVQHGRFVLTTAGGYDFWVGNNINANGEFEPSEEIQAYFKENGFRYIDKKGISEVKKFALEHPFHFIKLQFIKASKYFSLIRPTGWWPHLNKIAKSLTLILSGLFGVIGFVFGISGIYLALKKKNFFSQLLFYLSITAPIITILIVVGTRYRYQIYPFLAIFAAYFLVMFFIKKQKNLYKIPLVVFIILVLNSVYDLVTDFDVFLEHLHRII